VKRELMKKLQKREGPEIENGKSQMANVVGWPSGIIS
jgi:hypothetical protein